MKMRLTCADVKKPLASIAKIVAIADITGITASTTIEQASGPVAGFSSVPSPLKLNLSLKRDLYNEFY